jgi:hypothetical protein
MKRVRKQLNKGVTLIEVMVASLAVFVILVGVMNFQYYCALDARMADVRATAARLGQVLLEGWNAVQGEAVLYDPAMQFGSAPLNDLTPIGDPGIPRLINVFKTYMIGINGVKYFVTLSYEDQDIAPATPRRLRTLNVAIAWSRDFGSDTLTYGPTRLVRLTKQTSYIPPV